MKSMASKLSYLARSVAKLPQPERSACPNCGSRSASRIDSKYVVTRLNRCTHCGLQFRTPTDTETFSTKFYNHLYEEGTAMDLPGEAELVALTERNFRETDRDFAGYIDALARIDIRPPMRLLDFGCSWGYGSYQFAAAGFDTWSFEIAVGRRNFGIERLGVRHIDDLFEMGAGRPLFESFDCFFSAHVLEHVPAPSKVIDLAWKCLKPGGAFVAFTPNGCDAYRQYAPRSWSNMWGEVHPNFLDDQFYARQFPNSRTAIVSRDGKDPMQQYEFGFVAWKDASKGRF